MKTDAYGVNDWIQYNSENYAAHKICRWVYRYSDKRPYSTLQRNKQMIRSTKLGSDEQILHSCFHYVAVDLERKNEFHDNHASYNSSLYYVCAFIPE